MADSGQQEEANMADKSVIVDIVDENAAFNLVNTAGSHKKKSCFQITSVKVSENTNNDDNESIDDLDESHDVSTLSSDVALDLSKATDVDLSDENNKVSITPELIPNEENISHNSQGNGHGNGPSRFRVVKVETIEPIKRGRWTCTDYLDPAEKEHINVPPDRTKEKEPTGSGNSSAASSVHYVPGQDSNVENPLNVIEQQIQPSSTQTQPPKQNAAPTQNQQPPAAQPNQPQQSQNAVNNNAASVAAPQNNGHDSIQSAATQTGPASNPIDYGTHSMVEHIRDSLSVEASSGAPSTDGQSEGEDSASGASVGAIDNKIEQAMDLVKSHLMYAVREEVEVLKEQIKELLERNAKLEKENNSLRQQQQVQQVAATAPPSSAVPPPQATVTPQPVQQSQPQQVQQSQPQPVPQSQPQPLPQSQPQPGQPQMQSPNQSTPTEATAAQGVLTNPQTQS